MSIEKSQRRTRKEAARGERSFPLREIFLFLSTLFHLDGNNVIIFERGREEACLKP